MSDILDLIDHALTANERWPDAVHWSPNQRADTRDAGIDWVNDEEAQEIARAMWRRKCRRVEQRQVTVWFDECVDWVRSAMP